MTDTNAQFDCIVVGLGMTGVSVLDYLQAQGRNIAVVDTRQAPPGLEYLRQHYPQVPFYAGEFDAQLLCRARQLVVSPGVTIRNPAIHAAGSAGVELSSDVELFCQQAQAPIIAVTGSNGKSTVASLLTKMIEGSGVSVKLAGNIGKPVLELLHEAVPDYYVLELSSFQLETLRSMKAVAAVVLNISADHMDRYPGLTEYARAKQGVYAGDGTMILNRDDAMVSAMAQPGRKSIWYGLVTPAEGEFGVREFDGNQYLYYGKQCLVAASALKLHGVHNVSNALAALALGSAIGLPMTAMLAALQKFPGLPHRCQWVATINGVHWYNDSKGTNVGAACAAIQGLASEGKLFLIAGGDGKQADFSSLASTIREHVNAVILMGKDARVIERALAEGSQRYFACSMAAAVTTAARLAVAGDTVLLSPACASLDMYRDYQHRGEVFSDAVRALPGTRT